MVAEPVAAAFGIFWDEYRNKDMRDQTLSVTYLVSDMGGGTYDFTVVHFVLEYLNNDDRLPTLIADVIALDGDGNLGGADFTKALAVGCALMSIM